MPRKKPAKVNRRARGTGSIFFDRRRRVWRARKNGREKSSPNHADVVAWLNSVQPPASTITLADWSKRWLASLDVREQSRDNYRSYLDLRILPALGHLQVARVTPFDVQEAAKKWGSQVGATTVRHTLAALSACLQAAVMAELIARNPVKLVKRPRGDSPPPDPFTREELRRILAASLADRRLHPVALCAATGCRIGEALGFLPGDYDPAAALWSVARTVNRLRGVNPPKSPRSLRTITVPPEARAVLSRPFDTASHATVCNRWEALLKRLGLRHRGIHQLRHTLASILVADAVPLADAAAYLGDTVDVMARTYVHPVRCDVAARISGVLSGERVAHEPQKRGNSRRK